MNTVAIAGVGLIGGSFGLALRQAGWQGRILGVSSPRTLEEALRRGAIDEAVSLEEAAGRADLIYLAQPISTILATLDRLARLARPGCLVTDAGSTKVDIVRRASALPPQVEFLGGHPLAGKEARGVGAADARLFVGRTYVLTPRSAAALETPCVSAFMHMLDLIGAVPMVLDAEKHDAIVALTSHLPQLASTALASVVGSQVSDEQELRVSGPALRDSTRLALSSWEVWRDIIATNTANIEHVLGVYIDKLTEVRDDLRNQRLGVHFSAASEAASKIRRLGDRTTQQKGE